MLLTNHRYTRELLKTITNKSNKNIFEGEIIENKRPKKICVCRECKVLMEKYFNSVYKDEKFSKAVMEAMIIAT